MSDRMHLGHALLPANTDLDATAALAALGIVPDGGEAGDTDLLADWISNTATLWLRNFGVVGDGVADDTTAVQAALTAGATQGRIVYGGALTCKITSGLTLDGPGLVFDDAPHGDGGGCGFLVSGTLGGGGTPALTVTGQTQALRLTVRGTGQAANGVLFQNPLLAVVEHLRVYNLDGYGVKINRCWDCVFQTISIEECGNTSEYAFSMNDDGDTCNMTHIGRLQVEKANTQAIFISPNSLNLTIDAIHSEQGTPDASKSMWVLGGASCSYNNSRFSSNAPEADAVLWLRGAWSDYTGLRAENITTVLEGTSNTGITLVSPNLTGTTQEYSGQNGALVILGGTYGTWVGSTANRHLFQGAGAYLPLTGGTLSGALLLDAGNGQTAIRPASSYKGTGLSAAGTGTVLGTGGVAVIGDGNTIAITLIVNSRNEAVIALLQGGVHNVALLSLGGGTGTWSSTQGTVTSNNVYWDAGSSTYRVENTTTFDHEYHLLKVGAVATA
jgi:hypothetical protein